MTAHHRQRGMTLIELMVALVIGLILIFGVGEVFLSGRASYNVQQRLGDLQENGRFALYFLQRDIRMAGFPKSTPIDAFGTGGATPLTLEGGVNAAGAPNPDQITVSYQSATDCLGQAAAGGVAVNTYFIDSTPGHGRLMCRGNGNAQAQPLVEGVENMQIQYGEDLDADGYADRYVLASDGPNWNQVVAVRVAVLVSTIDPVLGDDPADRPTYRLLDAPPTAPLPPQVRGRVFTTTVEVRNRTR